MPFEIEILCRYFCFLNHPLLMNESDNKMSTTIIIKMILLVVFSEVSSK